MEHLRRASVPSTPEAADTPRSSCEKQCTSSSSPDDSTAWQLRFPLWEIGALTQPLHQQDPEISPLPNPIYSPEVPVESTLTVYGEFRSEVEPFPFPLGQPSFLDCTNVSSSIGRQVEAPSHPLDHRLVDNLIQSAQRWLLSYKQDQRAAPLSPSIYWSIWSLGFFYADSVLQAEQAGEHRLGRVEDDEWPDPPIGEDNYDWSLVSNWLYGLFNMDNLCGWGLHSVRIQGGGGV